MLSLFRADGGDSKGDDKLGMSEDTELLFVFNCTGVAWLNGEGSVHLLPSCTGGGTNLLRDSRAARKAAQYVYRQFGEESWQGAIICFFANTCNDLPGGWQKYSHWLCGDDIIVYIQCRSQSGVYKLIGDIPLHVGS